MDTCLAVAVLAGQLLTIQPNAAHTSDFNGRSIEIQSCTRGPGGFVMASDSGLYAGGIQYGVEARYHEILMTAQPFFGASYTPREVSELPLHAQFWAGLNLLVEYRGILAGVKYGHASNGGLTEHNAGVDVFTMMVGINTGTIGGKP